MLAKIKEIVVKYVDVDPEKITEQTDFRNDLDIDSFSFMSMIAEIEEEAGVELPLEEVTELTTVNDLLELIAKKGQE
ncbi:MAG: acyl carrier protein [Tidjanibacter sp.]|nr:acyl carrier protein [Tidjanibacter sp.]